MATRYVLSASSIEIPLRDTDEVSLQRASLCVRERKTLVLFSALYGFRQSHMHVHVYMYMCACMCVHSDIVCAVYRIRSNYSATQYQAPLLRSIIHVFFFQIHVVSPISSLNYFLVALSK